MNPRTCFVLGAVLLAAVSRTIPHPWNFAPMTAMAVFSAATLTNRRLALLTPLLALFVSDLAIEGLHRLSLMETWGIYKGMWVTYAATLAVALLGLALRQKQSVPDIALVTLAGSCLFFVTTNFAVWAGGGFYPPTAEGLALCYMKAIPFFRNSLLGDATYAVALFGGLALAQARFPALRAPRPAGQTAA
jgi:hypothetical protein